MMVDRNKVYKMYIQGQWVDAADGGLYPVVNPATEQVIGHVADGTRGDVQRAIQAARRAFDEGPWPRMNPRERGYFLRRLAERMAEDRERLRELLMEEAGATTITHHIQLELPIQFMFDYSEWVLRFNFEEPLPSDVVRLFGDAGARVVSSLLVRQPVGVCGLITTWNFPLYVLVQKLGPALAAGCTVVVKPPPYTPLIHLEVVRLAEEIGFPPGVINVVTGQGVELGEELVVNPLVDKISFTGSVPTGKRIMELASRTLKRIHLELGGKSPNIILGDQVDASSIAPAVASPAYFHAGQGCAMATRALVPKKLQDSIVAEIVSFLKAIKIGDPRDPTTQMGPLIREERRKRVMEFIHLGVREGAELVYGGNPLDYEGRGYFLQPTVFANCRNEMTICKEEIFGPVLAVIPYERVDEAVAIANDSRYGLAASIISANTAQALDLAKRLRVGTVSINGASNLRFSPFGGFKESGVGREGGVFGIQEFTEIQAIHWLT
jgi:aldehyde dehydrogenase (NAD+)